MYNLKELSAEEVNLIADGLRELPYKKVAGLFNKILVQVKTVEAEIVAEAKRVAEAVKDETGKDETGKVESAVKSEVSKLFPAAPQASATSPASAPVSLTPDGVSQPPTPSGS